MWSVRYDCIIFILVTITFNSSWLMKYALFTLMYIRGYLYTLFLQTFVYKLSIRYLKSNSLDRLETWIFIVLEKKNVLSFSCCFLFFQPPKLLRFSHFAGRLPWDVLYYDKDHTTLQHLYFYFFLFF